jgi:hypothetical protein
MQAERKGPTHQIEGGEQSVKSEHMVSMQMADENVVDLAELDTTLPELHLGSLAAIYQKQTLMCI